MNLAEAVVKIETVKDLENFIKWAKITTVDLQDIVDDCCGDTIPIRHLPLCVAFGVIYGHLLESCDEGDILDTYLGSMANLAYQVLDREYHSVSFKAGVAFARRIHNPEIAE